MIVITGKRPACEAARTRILAIQKELVSEDDDEDDGGGIGDPLILAILVVYGEWVNLVIVSAWNLLL